MSLRSLSRALVASLVACLVAFPLAAQDELPAPRDPSVEAEDRLDILVEKIRIESARRESLEADFIQTKESALFLEPVRSTGVFSYRSPDQARWEYVEPDPVSLVIAGEEMLTWYRDLGKAERFNVGKQSQRVLEYLSASSSIGTLLEYFDVRMHTPADPSAPYLLEMSPRFKRIEKRVKKIELWIEPENYLPVRLRYLEADDDVTEYEFRNFRVNEELPSERFELEIPAGVDVEERRLGQERPN